MSKFTKLDVADYLETDEDIREFLLAAMEEGDTQHLVNCLSIAARAKGMTAVANTAGVTRASLYKSLEEGANPKLETISKLLRVFGCKLTIAAAEELDHQMA